MDDLKILTEIPDIKYHEAAPQITAEEFDKVVLSRRSVRVFTGEALEDKLVEHCLDLALLSPTSSNLQSWGFIRIVDPAVKKSFIPICLNQNACKTASELIVCISYLNRWKEMNQLMLKSFDEAVARGEEVPKIARTYYEKIVPLVYDQGPFGIKGLVKRVILFLRGLKTPSPREPKSHADMRVWAHKSTALACQTLMLALRAHGMDTCPMEGFDSKRAKKLLNLPDDQEITMILGVGKRAPKGIYGPRVRFDRNLFVRKI
jgi:nitroreductase